MYSLFSDWLTKGKKKIELSWNCKDFRDELCRKERAESWAHTLSWLYFTCSLLVAAFSALFTPTVSSCSSVLCTLLCSWMNETMPSSRTSLPTLHSPDFESLLTFASRTQWRQSWRRISPCFRTLVEFFSLRESILFRTFVMSGCCCRVLCFISSHVLGFRRLLFPLVSKDVSFMKTIMKRVLWRGL